MNAAYVRISTKDQNPDLQREEIGARANAHGIKDVIWYEDRISGDKSSRPRLDALRKDIFAGKVKTVILWKLARLARSKRDGEALLADWCGRNVRIVSVTQQIDPSGVVGTR
jgi:DNA invertase Pin-like site-specific DNA recombinase